MSTDARDPRIPACNFFHQLRAYGFDSTQLIRVASELIELITCSLREAGDSRDSPEASTPSRARTEDHK